MMARSAANVGGFFCTQNQQTKWRNVYGIKILVMALGAGLAVWGVINLLEGYGSDNPAAKSQGIKQLMAGGGVVLIGMQLIPLLSGLFS